MNEIEFAFCSKFIQKIKENPFSNVIMSSPNEIENGITFAKIEEKVNNLVYASIYDFAIDFNDFMYDKIDLSEINSPEYYILKDFIEQFQNKIQNAPRNEKELKAKKIRKLCKIIRIIIGMMEPKYQEGKNVEIPQMKSTSSFSSLIKQSELDELQKKIDQITDEKILIKVYQILRENIPDFRFKTDVVIDKTQINQKCLKSLKSLLI